MKKKPFIISLISDTRKPNTKLIHISDTYADSMYDFCEFVDVCCYMGIEIDYRYFDRSVTFNNGSNVRFMVKDTLSLSKRVD